MQANTRENVLNVEIAEDLVYRPKTKETKAYYEQMLVIVQRHMGDHSLEDFKGALDEVISILKAEGMKDSERKEQIESLPDIDRLSDGDFNTLTVLGQQLTDFLADGQKAPGVADGQDEMNELPVDPEMEFSGNDSGDASDIDKVKDSDSENDDGPA